MEGGCKEKDELNAPAGARPRYSTLLPPPSPYPRSQRAAAEAEAKRLARDRLALGRERRDLAETAGLLLPGKKERAEVEALRAELRAVKVRF